jgi:hypothetical protein
MLTSAKPGRQLWVYDTLPDPKELDPELYYRLGCWRGFFAGATGAGFWSLSDEGGTPSSYNPYLRARPGFSPAYITPNSLEDGIHWEAMMEGAEDCDLFRRLAEDCHGTPEEVEARNLLSAAASGAASPVAQASPWRSRKPSQEWDAFRLKALNLLLRIKGSNR